MEEIAFYAAASMVHARRNETVTKFNQVYSRLSKNSQLTPFQKHIQKVVTSDDITETLSTSRRYFLLHMFMPAVDRACEYVFRGKVAHEASLTIFALRRWRLEKGQYPESLLELLTAGYLHELPDDPYSDSILRYEKRDDDFILYSLGTDFDDDNGWQNPDKLGNQLRKESDDDYVFWPPQ